MVKEYFIMLMETEWKVLGSIMSNMEKQYYINLMAQYNTFKIEEKITPFLVNSRD